MIKIEVPTSERSFAMVKGKILDIKKLVVWEDRDGNIHFDPYIGDKIGEKYLLRISKAEFTQLVQAGMNQL